MQITGIRAMRLLGPLVHGEGGETGGKIGKVIVRVDTDAGIYGLGEADDFMGVREGIAYMHDYFMGRDPFEANRDHLGDAVGLAAAASADGPSRARWPDGIVAVPSSSPTAIPPGLWPGRPAPSTRAVRPDRQGARRARVHPARRQVPRPDPDLSRPLVAARDREPRRRGGTMARDAVDAGLHAGQVRHRLRRLRSPGRRLEPVARRSTQINRDGGAAGDRARRGRARLRALRRPALASTTCPTRSGVANALAPLNLAVARRSHGRHQPRCLPRRARRAARSPSASARCSSPSSSGSSSTMARSTSSIRTCCSAAGCTRCAGSPTTRTSIGCRWRCTATAARWQRSRPPTSRPPAATSSASSTTSSRRPGSASTCVGSVRPRDAGCSRTATSCSYDAPGLGIELDEEVCRANLGPGRVALRLSSAVE